MKKFIFIIFCLMNIFSLADEVRKIDTKALVKAISQYELWGGEPVIVFDQKGNLWCLHSQPNRNFPIYDLDGNIGSYTRIDQALSIISPDGNAILLKKVLPGLLSHVTGIGGRTIEFDQWGNGLIFYWYTHFGYRFMKVSPEGEVLWWKPESLETWPIQTDKVDGDTVYAYSFKYIWKFLSTDEGVKIVEAKDIDDIKAEFGTKKYGNFIEETEKYYENRKTILRKRQKSLYPSRKSSMIVTPSRRMIRFEGIITKIGELYLYEGGTQVDYNRKIVYNGIIDLIDVKKMSFRKFKNATMPLMEVIQLPDKNYIVNLPVEEENAVYQVKLNSEGNVIEPEKLETVKAKRFEDLKSGQRFVQFNPDDGSPARLRKVYVYFIGFDDTGMLYWSKYKVK